VIYLAGLIPIPGLDITPLAFVASGLCCAWALFRYHMLDLVPAARETVIEHMRDDLLDLSKIEAGKGQGSTFTIFLPAPAHQPDQLPRLPGARDKPAASILSAPARPGASRRF
jgi:N-terminal 7TM region of histidine kinase